MLEPHISGVFCKEVGVGLAVGEFKTVNLLASNVGEIYNSCIIAALSRVSLEGAPSSLASSPPPLLSSGALPSSTRALTDASPQYSSIQVSSVTVMLPLPSFEVAIVCDARPAAIAGGGDDVSADHRILIALRVL